MAKLVMEFAHKFLEYPHGLGFSPSVRDSSPLTSSALTPLFFCIFLLCLFPTPIFLREPRVTNFLYYSFSL